jgi:hypothetical protein
MRAFRPFVAVAVLLLGGFNLAHGADAVLVPCDPPLTRVTFDQYAWIMEWVLDLKFTEQQRNEMQALFIDGWKKDSQAERQKQVTSLEKTWKDLSQMKPYQLNKLRFPMQSGMLAKWSRPDASALNRWLVARHQEAFKPGSTRNPILVPGEPALTQQLVDRYGDYVEWVLDFSISGGLSTDQRRVLRDYLVKDWKTMDRDAFLATVKEWVEVAAKLPDVWQKWTDAERPKLLAKLQTAQDERSKWLLESCAQERKKFELLSALEKQRHETAMSLIENLKPPPGYWRTNPVTGRTEWVSRY